MSNEREIVVRTISIADAASVRQLSFELGYVISLQNTEANIREILKLKTHIAMVAISQDKIEGWVHAFETRTLESLPFIELAGLVVNESSRGKGIGKILIERIKQWSLERNIPFLRIRSNVVRKEAHKFYTNLGFTEIKEQKVFQMSL